MQAKDWSDKDAGMVHKSRLEREKEAAAAARSAILLTIRTDMQAPLKEQQDLAPLAGSLRCITLLCRRESLASADQAAVRRLVQGTFARVASNQGKGLGEVCCTRTLLIQSHFRHTQMFVTASSPPSWNSNWSSSWKLEVTTGQTD
jgi:hypothetical protein